MYVIKYISPVYLLIVFAFWVSQNAMDRVRSIIDPPPVGPPVVAMSIALVVLVAITFLLVISRSTTRWAARRARTDAAADQRVTP